jgi:hypothetical protein
MYLHIGSETIVPEKDLIGIFDLDNTSVSKFTREYLRSRQQQGMVVTVAEDIPKSFVVCVPPGDPIRRLRRGKAPRGKNGALPARETVYLSQLAASTLRKRSR